jgi:TPR repeat protein
VKNESESEAAKHYELAVNQNHASAQFQYAVCLEQGRSVPKNQIEAARYCKLAANQNDTSSQWHSAERMSTF